jgi:NADPH:quinone reductase-like Zn-dependent oxidoreductase
VPVPAGVDPADAETVVTNGVAAWQLLYRKARDRPGSTILVHGGNGGVGSTLV